MRIRDLRAVSILAALTLLGYSACAAGSDNDDPYPGPTVGGTGSGGSKGSGTGGEDSAGAGGEPLAPGPGIDLGGSSSSMGGGDGVETCAATVSKAELLPLDLYFMIDTSGSMLREASDGVTKWEAVKTALEAFFQDETSAEIGVGLQYFPLKVDEDVPYECTANADCLDAGPCQHTTWCYYLGGGCNSNLDCAIGDPCVPAAVCAGNPGYICSQPGGDCGNDEQENPLGMCTLLYSGLCADAASCNASDYATPAVEIEPLSTNALALLDSLAEVDPEGGTPTSRAVMGAIDQVRDYAEEHPDHTVVAVLATDGLPSHCEPWDIEGVATLTAQGLEGDPSVRTFVLGVLGDDDAGTFSSLNTIATAGGQPAFLINTSDDVGEQFREALDDIRAASLSCDLRIPAAEDGETLDYAFVNVTSHNGDDSVQLGYVGGQGDCDDEGGWYYNVNPSAGVPSRIILCPASCEGLQGSAENSVKIEVGCATVVK
jgi:hypothetical protein